MGCGTITRFKIRASWVDEYATYDLVWIGTVFWTRFSPDISVFEVYYRYEVDLTVEKVGPGTTNPSPGVYHVDGGSDYEYTASAALTEFPDEYFFKFVKWVINDGYSTWEEYGSVCSGTAYTDTTITAIFETVYMSYCRILYEDGLEGGYLWRDDHVLLVVRPVKMSDVTVTILSDYGEYSKTFRTGVRSFCIYFSADRFVGDYIVYVSATNELGSYMPKTQVAGVD